MMFGNPLFILLLIIIGGSTGDLNTESDKTENTEKSMYSEYAGTKFPIEYLVPDKYVPTVSDLNRYLNNMQRLVRYFGNFLNETDGSGALCLFLSKCILKRTLLDSGSKLHTNHITFMSNLINDIEFVLSHYIYSKIFEYDRSDIEHRFSRLLQNDQVLVQNLGNFNRNRLEPWIYTDEYMNDYMEEIDEASLPRDEYVKLVHAMSDFFISIDASDICVSRVVYNPEPTDLSVTRPCEVDRYCEYHIMSTPSVAYSLSHRMLNVFLRLKARNCYIISEQEDLQEIDKLCAFMYRETVYIARRGYFARDLFLEYISLCSMLGYVEFHRLRWFSKSVSWMNEYDCIKENRNFELNYTVVSRSVTRRNVKRRSQFEQWRCRVLNSPCDDHASALMLTTLSAAVRYSARFMQTA